MNIEIRKAGIGDEAILARIQTESWKAAFASILDPETLHKCTDADKAREMYRRLLENCIGNGYLLFADGKPHCIAWWDAARDAEFAGKAELICLHSLPDHWRCGCGRAMMARVLSDIQAAGYSEVVLWVFQDNTRARAFYEAMGYQLTPYRKEGHGAAEVCYAKGLLG